jgi:hypothetical protein
MLSWDPDSASTEHCSAQPLLKQDGAVLLHWLALLGWPCRLEQDGNLWVGLARHIADDGTPCAVSAVALSKSETAWQLFEAVVGRLDSTRVDRESPRHRAARRAAAAA